MEDLSEKEQLDAMRTWWSENGRYVIGGVVLGVAILYGWNQWRSGISSAQMEASEMYEEVMTGVGDGNAEAAAAAGALLFENHPGTAYASQGRLAMARLYMDKGRDQDAVIVLQGLVDEDPDSEVGLVGRLRLARVLLYQDKAEEVVALLEDNLDNAFSSRFNEVLGDAYAALGSYAEAADAYSAAMVDSQSPSTVDTNLIQLKMNDLPSVENTTGDAANDVEIARGPVAETDEETVEETGDETVEEAPDAAADDSGEEAQQ